MSLIEIVAVFFSLLCVFLTIRKNVWSWPVGIIGVAAYLLLFIREKLYADMILQGFFILQGFYGWYNWYQNKKVNDEVSVSFLSNSIRLIYGIVLMVITLIWAILLKRFTNASLPYVDAFASTASFIANWLMAKRKTENWILWIIADIVYVGLFWYKELYLSSGIYLLFLGMSIAGFIKWKKSIHTSTVLS